MPLKWDLVDESPNRILEVTKVKRVLFTKVRAMFFLGKLVKNQMEVKKFWPLPLLLLESGIALPLYLLFRLRSLVELVKPHGLPFFFLSKRCFRIKFDNY